MDGIKNKRGKAEKKTPGKDQHGVFDKYVLN
jgi:hypothetical protein